MKPQVVTLDKAVHSLFFNVAGATKRQGRVRVELGPMNDPEVGKVILDMSPERASELGLVD